jgi:hypothetical protein
MKVSLGANHKVVALSYGDAGGLQRFGVSLPAQSMKFRRATNAAGPAADSIPWGELSAREGGGLQMTVTNAGDTIDVMRGGGANFAQMRVTANQLNVGALNRPGVVVDGANANVVAGAMNNEGDVLVFDGHNRLTVALNGGTGHVIIGHKEVPGQLRMLGGREGGDRLRLEAATGAAVVERIDAINGANVEVTSILSIDGILRAKGDILMGNPARKMAAVWMESHTGTADQHDVDLGFPRQCTAYATLVMVNSLTDFDYDNAVFADIASVDGVPLGTWISGDGSNLGSLGDWRNMRWPTWSGVGRIITFRTFALGPDIECAGIGIVFYE